MYLEQDVQSTAILHVGYDTDSHILSITFANGAVYDYPDMTEDQYHRLVTAESVGKYYNKSIAPIIRNRK